MVCVAGIALLMCDLDAMTILAQPTFAVVFELMAGTIELTVEREPQADRASDVIDACGRSPSRV
jgi:hypothetical protein